MNQNKPYWISWYSPKSLGGWELHSPWWVSGYTYFGEEEVPAICAAVMAIDEKEAKDKIYRSYDELPKEAIEWRFVNERSEDWSPFSERFPQAAWMKWP